MKNSNKLSKLILNTVNFYYDIADKNFHNLSSFAIVTDESFRTFLIAINTNVFFTDVKEGKVSSETYWNTAEWTEEALDYKFPSDDMEEINDLLNSEDQVSELFFLECCTKALDNIRSEENANICLFVHITDFAYSESLFEIVKDLNGTEVAKNYQKYFLN